MKTIFFTLLLCCSALEFEAQTTLQVVTRNIRKTIPWKPGSELIINCEKADIEVRPSDTNELFVSAELSAKHPGIEQATADLGSWQFVTSTLGKKIYIRAYVGLKNGKTAPESNMKLKMTVLVPKDCPVNLSNKFGKARLEHLECPIALTGEFCKFELYALGGKIEINSQYGKIAGDSLYGSIEIQSKRAEIQMDHLSVTNCAIHSEYGNVTLAATEQSGTMTVVGNKSDIGLELPGFKSHNFTLNAAFGSLITPDEFDSSGSSTDHPKAVLLNQKNDSWINLETTFGKITIKH